MTKALELHKKKCDGRHAFTLFVLMTFLGLQVSPGNVSASFSPIPEPARGAGEIPSYNEQIFQAVSPNGHFQAGYGNYSQSLEGRGPMVLPQVLSQSLSGGPQILRKMSLQHGSPLYFYAMRGVHSRWVMGVLFLDGVIVEFEKVSGKAISLRAISVMTPQGIRFSLSYFTRERRRHVRIVSNREKHAAKKGSVAASSRFLDSFETVTHGLTSQFAYKTISYADILEKRVYELGSDGNIGRPLRYFKNNGLSPELDLRFVYDDQIHSATVLDITAKRFASYKVNRAYALGKLTGLGQVKAYSSKNGITAGAWVEITFLMRQAKEIPVYVFRNGQTPYYTIRERNIESRSDEIGTVGRILQYYGEEGFYDYVYDEDAGKSTVSMTVFNYNTGDFLKFELPRISMVDTRVRIKHGEISREKLEILWLGNAGKFLKAALLTLRIEIADSGIKLTQVISSVFRQTEFRLRGPPFLVPSANIIFHIVLNKDVFSAFSGSFPTQPLQTQQFQFIQFLPLNDSITQAGRSRS